MPTGQATHADDSPPQRRPVTTTSPASASAKSHERPRPRERVPSADDPRPHLPARVSSKSARLPADLERFLARYPHPAFALRASVLYDALVARKEPYAPRPIDLAGGASSTVPQYGAGATSAGRVRGSKEDKQQLSSREQYEGGIEPDSSPSPSSGDGGDDSAPSHEASGGESRPVGTDGDMDASHSDAESDSSLGPSVSQVASPNPRSPPPLHSTLTSPNPHNTFSPPASSFSRSLSTDSGAPTQPFDSNRIRARSLAPSAAGSGVSRAGSTASAAFQRRAADAGNDPRGHARSERILADAFEAGTGPSRRDPKALTQRGSYLEGGAQKSHDPSRTAEGAVKAMYEQREKRDQDEKDEEKAIAERESGLEAERLLREQEEFEARDRWSARRSASEGGNSGGSGDSSVSDSSHDVDAAAAGPRGFGLKALLTPVWRNGKWCELMALRDDTEPKSSTADTPEQHATGVMNKSSGHGTAQKATDDHEELGLLSLLSRADLQECLAMLTNVVSTLGPGHQSEDARQAETPLAQLNHTVLLELSFPENSIYRHPPGSSFQHDHVLADSGRRHYATSAQAGSTVSSGDGSGSSGTTVNGVERRQRSGGVSTTPAHPILPRNPPSDRTRPIYSPQNPYATDAVSELPDPPLAKPASNQNPAVPPTHRGVQQVAETLLPFLQVVATLQPENDLVVCTTILANMPLPVTLTGSPGQDDREEIRADKRENRTSTAERRSHEYPFDRASSEAADSGPSRRDHEPHASKRELRSPPAESPSSPFSVGLPPVRGPARVHLHSTPSFGSTSPFPDGFKPSRPPLTQRSTSYSSVSGASSGGSTVVGRPPGTRTTPEDRSPQEQHRERFHDSSTSEASRTRYGKPSPSVSSPRRNSQDEGLASTARGSTESQSPTLSPAILAQSSSEQFVEPTYAYGLSSAPLQTPSVSDELKELWDDTSRRSNDDELPRGFVKEKESRAAVRRRGPGGVERRDLRESDNDGRERERRRQSKKRDKDWKREQDERNRGHEGLGDLAEQDEPEESDEEEEKIAAQTADEAQAAAELAEAYDGVLGYDEEDTDEVGEDADGDTDHEEMDRLRVKTRTGSTSSDGSAREREKAATEAHRAQAQQQAEERQSQRQERQRLERRRSSEEDLAHIRSVTPPVPARHRRRDIEQDERILQEELGRPEDESRLVFKASQNDGQSSTGSDSSRASSTYSLSPDRHRSAVHGGGSETMGDSQLTRYGDSFLDVVGQTECGRAILSVNWQETSLGDIRSWGSELRTHVMAMLASPFHTAIWYGADNVLLYNDAYARLLGPTKHPNVLGKSGAEGWSELWDVLGPLAGQLFSGKTLSYSDHCNCIMRNGVLEETYHSWAYITIRDSQARIIGYVNPSFETTARVIAERRLGTLRELTQLTHLARTTKGKLGRYFCAKALRALSGNALDIPFAILYTCETLSTAPTRRTKGDSSTTESGASRTHGRSNDSGGGKSSAKKPGKHGDPTSSMGADASPTIARMRLTLQGCIGVPDGHPSAVQEVNVLLDTAAMQDGPERSSVSSVSSASGTNSTNEENSSSTIWPFIEALQTRKPVFITELGDRTKGFPHRGWPDDVRRAVLMPIITEGSTMPKALLIVGLNPRRPFNAVMAQFFNLVSRTLSTGLLGIEVAEEQTRKSRELSELNDARQAFFANISHELRTPLTLILGPLEDVLSSRTTSLDGEDRERLEVVQRNAHRLLNMVNTLLDFSRLESGKMNTVFRPTLLGPRTADLAALFRSAIEHGGVDYQVEIEEDKWASTSQFYLSDEMYEKIIFNLIGNAFKYTPPKPGCRISVRVTFSAKEGVVSIQDTGIGVDEKELELIFDRFHRVDSAARSFEGTGIGLSLVLELVKALGGTITVESKLGEGSTFTVRLPRGHAHLPDAVIEHEPFESVELPPRAAQSLAIINDAASWRVDGGSGEQIDGGSEANRKMLIGTAGRRSSESEQLPSVFNLEKSKTVCLVVDDNAQLRSFIGKTLSKSFAVVEKANGKEAFEYAKAHPEISIVVTDLAMPVMSGRELLAALRNHPETSLVPVIFLSAQAGAEARVDALLLGADDYIVKPFQARELLARVNVHLQLGHMRKELERRVTERTAALMESEKKLKELAEQHQTLALVSPVGIFQCDTEGKIVFTNPRYLEISHHPPDVPLDQFESDLHPEDVARVRELWHNAVADWRADKPVSTFEYRYKAGNWAQLEVRSFDKGYIGSITDISHQKEVEAFHIREVEQRAQEAEENRRNTEMFLDMSSHELRNPLSGVWQNAEVVGGSLEKFVDFLDDLRNRPDAAFDSATVEELHSEMLENVDAIESIMLCASHQTRIADDILNVSKLNMGLLSINVAPFALVAAVREVVKTFEVQSHQQQIKLVVEKGPSLSALNVDWIVADSGRIKQVTYNFLTNALKYTVDSSRKSVTVHVDAYDGPPPTPANAMRIAAPNQSFEPPEDCVWCVVGVQDSGKGLSSEQLKLLFARFSQANPKSDQYGGSGLGLYVSKKLVELHRGFIEVESELGHGSTFRFAIPAPRSAPPAIDEAPPISPTPTLGGTGVRSKRPTSAGGRPALTSFSSTTSSSAGSSVGLAPLHILVVEDNLINQKVMMRQLRMQNFQVSLASDGQQALDLLMEDAKRTAEMAENNAASPTNAGSADGDEPTPAHNPIRCVLMDIEMPVLDGMSAVRELRRREKAGEISRRYPVCAVTGNARDAQKRECLAAGFDDVATKPYRLAELLQQVSTLTGLPLPAPK